MRRHAKAIVAISAVLLTLALSATLASAVAPVVTVEDASNVSYTTADLKGTVNPEGQFTTWRFQFITEALFQENLSNGLPGFEEALERGGNTETEETLERHLIELIPGTTYHLRLRAENGDGQSEAVANTFTTEAVGPPSVSIDPVTTITATSAHLSGTINPGTPAGNPPAFDVDWHFECTPACPDVIGGSIPADSATPAVEVEAEASGLEPNTEYEVSLVAENAGGSQSDAALFETELELPVVHTLPAAVITNNSAWIGGEVNPRNSPTTYYIEYSPNEDFLGSTNVPASLDSGAGSGSALVHASREVSGLAPSTTYYVRLHAENEAGPVTGDAISFETLSQPRSKGLPNGRVWERVSPVDKKGASILPGNYVYGAAPFGYRSQVSADGQTVAYGSAGKWDGEGGPANSQYLGRRGSNGWSSEGINPRHYGGIAGQFVNHYVWLSEDLSQGIVTVQSGLNPGDPNGILNLYVRDNASRTYRTISNAPASAPEGSSQFSFEAASLDGGHVVFTEYQGPLLERTPTGDVRVVSVLPDGTQVRAAAGIATGPAGSPGQYTRGFNSVSADGSRIYFSPLEGVVSGATYEGALYLRGNGSSTTLVSSSERSGDDPEEPHKATFEGASADGSVAYFTSNDKLTDDSVAGCPAGSFCHSLYRWDSDASSGERLTDLTTADAQGNVIGTTLMSADGSSVYFVAEGQLADGAVRGAPNLYLWREGEGIRLVAPVGDQGLWQKEIQRDGSGTYREARVSSDGRYLAFASGASLTAYDTSGTAQIYLYDSETEELSCVSCGTVFAHSKDSSFFLSAVSEKDYSLTIEYLTRNLSEDGSRIVFDSADALLPEDTNGVTDVYEWTGGQLHLISTGSGEQPSRFLDAGANGDDVFFTTGQRLVRSDPDNLVDLYDARVGGVEEPAEDPPCIADECQGTPSPPPFFQSPGSSTFSGDQTPRKAKHPRRSCRKGKPRRHGKCVRSKKSQSRKNHERGRGK